jgi:hemolysin activation/secretion protein
VQRHLLSIILAIGLLGAAPSQRVTVQQFKVSGSSVFDSWELANVTQPYEARSLTLEELQSAADAITRYYLDHGYLTSRAVLTDQTIENGIVHIQIIEGNLEKIEVQGNRRIAQSYIRDRIQLAGTKPLNQEQLEHHLRLLRDDPLFSNVEATLKEGTQPGNSILRLRVSEATPQTAQFSLDNTGTPSIGSTLLSAVAGTRNLTGNRDALWVSYARSSTGGANLWDFSYQRSLNARQGTLSLRVAPSRYRITQPGLQDLSITGSSNLYELTLRQPLNQTPQGEFALSLSVLHRSGKTLIGDFLTNTSHSNVIRFGQDFLHRDRQGLWLARSQMSLGQAEARFFTWSGQLQRLQPLGKNHLLTADLTWQLTPDRLGIAQQFSFGGAQSLRGYPQSSFSGDNGVVLSIADQITLQRSATGAAILKLVPFIDLGTLWNHPKQIVQETPRLYTSAGLGMMWQPTDKWSLKLEAAFPLAADAPSATVMYFYSNYRF